MCRERDEWSAPRYTEGPKAVTREGQVTDEVSQKLGSNLANPGNPSNEPTPRNSLEELV
jgi:hypothetical protein